VKEFWSPKNFIKKKGQSPVQSTTNDKRTFKRAEEGKYGGGISSTMKLLCWLSILQV